jgi:hypothetical protein
MRRINQIPAMGADKVLMIFFSVLEVKVWGQEPYEKIEYYCVLDLIINEYEF